MNTNQSTTDENGEQYGQSANTYPPNQDGKFKLIILGYSFDYYDIGIWFNCF